MFQISFRTLRESDTRDALKVKPSLFKVDGCEVGGGCW